MTAPGLPVHARDTRVLWGALCLTIVGCGSAGPAELPGPPPFSRTAADTTAVEVEPPAEADTIPPAPEAPPWEAFLLDTVSAEPSDQGRMWTFDALPAAYLEERYGVVVDEAWAERARASALRLAGCSASIVSPHGLVLTNHHCVRDVVSALGGLGERLVVDGFTAKDLSDERPMPEVWADQLVEIVDLTDTLAGELADLSEDERATARPEVIDRLRSEHELRLRGEDERVRVEVVEVHGGARVSAYVYRRYEDVRLVFVPELEVASFGGAEDNFTYPRYTLDLALLRLYEDGEPARGGDWFPVDPDGLEDGDAVFAIGSPGTTTRGQTAAELAFRRDVGEAATIGLLEARIEGLTALGASAPDPTSLREARTALASLTTLRKAYRGQRAALGDAGNLARRAAADRALADSIRSNDERSALYGGLIEEMAELQEEKRAQSAGYQAFLGLTSAELSSATLRRSLLAFQLLNARQAGAPAETVQALTDQIVGVVDRSPAVDSVFVHARIDDFIRHYGGDSPLVRGVLRGSAPGARAGAVVRGSLLARSGSAAVGLDHLTVADPGIAFVRGYIPTYVAFLNRSTPLFERESELETALARARWEVFGEARAPDATSSPRLSDGMVAGYEVGGTRVPASTTMFGLFDRHFAYFDAPEWALPARWLEARASLDLATPMNVVATTDVVGGSSGSALVDADLELVGVVFDRNYEGLGSDFIYRPERARAVAVDIRALLESLDVIYDADRLALELIEGELVASEADADARRR